MMGLTWAPKEGQGFREADFNKEELGKGVRKLSVLLQAGSW